MFFLIKLFGNHIPGMVLLAQQEDQKQRITLDGKLVLQT